MTQRALYADVARAQEIAERNRDIHDEEATA